MEETDYVDEEPLCPHYETQMFCAEKCVCGHECREHTGLLLECAVAGCDCREFTKPEENANGRD